MSGGCIFSISPCQPLHAVWYPFDCSNIVCLIPFPNINQTPKQNYPSKLEKISRYPKENEAEVFLNMQAHRWRNLEGHMALGLPTFFWEGLALPLLNFEFCLNLFK